MSLLLKGFAALAAATVMSTSASAQAVVTQRELSLAAAQLMADAAVEHCRKGGFRISVTIVDSGGQIRLFHKDDGANPHTVDASFRKAYTARTYRVPSADFMKRTEVGATGGRPGLRRSTTPSAYRAGSRSRSATRPSAVSALPARRAIKATRPARPPGSRAFRIS